MNPYRKRMVDQAERWLDYGEHNGLYKRIIDIYNNYPVAKRPRKVNMKYDWPWCACTWSAMVIACDLTSICPIEISCGNLIEEAKKMGCWNELDSYIASPGDAILYDWDDDGVGDNTGWPDHVGIVVDTDCVNKTFTVIEGNYNRAVRKREIGFDSKYIRGFICPKYESLFTTETKEEPKLSRNDVIVNTILGKYGNMPERKERVEATGYSYEEIQNEVNILLKAAIEKLKEQEE